MTKHTDPIQEALNRARQGPAFQFFGLQTETDAQRIARLDLIQKEEDEAVFETAGERKQAALEIESATFGVAQWLAETINFPTDPDYIPPDTDSDTFKELTSGVPPEYWPRLARARSKRHEIMIRDDILRELDARSKLEKDGWTGTTLRMAMLVADPITLTTILLNPAVSVLTRGSRLAKAAKFSAVAGAENTALEALLFKTRETKSADDLYYALVGGMLLGAGLGALIPNKTAYAATKKALNEKLPDKVGVEETFAAFDNELSAGAAEARVAKPLSTTKVPAELVDTPRLEGLESKLRFDWHASVARSENPYMRGLGDKLLADPVGTPGMVQAATAEEFAILLKKRALVKFYQPANPDLKEVLKGVPLGKRQAAADDFFEEVTRAISAENFTNTPVGRTARGASEAMQDAAREAKRFGVEGFESLEIRPGYIPHISKAAKIETLLGRFGDKQVVRLLATAFARSSGVELKYATRVARGYLHGTRLRGAGVDREFSLTLADKDVITDFMRKAGVPDNEIDEVVQQLKVFGEKDTSKAGKIARAKRRLDLDESTVMKLKDRNGEIVDVSILDLFETDARLLVRMYVSTVGGHAALARAGFKSQAEWGAYIRAARLYEVDELTRGGKKINAEIAKIEMARDVIVGRPLIDYENPANALIHATRDWAYMAQSGMFGFAQASEVAAVLTAGGLKLTLANVPRLKAIFTRARNGLLKDADAREMEEFVAPGTDALLHSTLTRFTNEFDEFAAPQTAGLLGKTARLRHGLTKAAGYLSALTPITIGMQRVQASNVAQRLVNTAFKRGRGWSNMRLRAMGLTRVMEKRAFAQIRKYAKTRKSAEAGKEIPMLDLAKWDDLDARDAFVLAVQRETNRTVLVPSLGGSIPTVKSTEVGAALTQFLTFAIQAHSRLLLHGIKHMDAERAVAWLFGTGLAGMAYVARMQLESIGRRDKKKFLRERLSPERIAAAAFNLSGYSALLPIVIDTSLSVIPGGDPIFSYSRTSGLGTSLTDLSRFPTGAIVQGVGNSITALRDGELTQGEWNQMQRMIPFSRVLGIRNALNILGQQLPEQKR